MKKGCLIIIGFLAVVFFSGVLVLRNADDEVFGFNREDARCAAFQEIKFVVFNGIVDSVFEDKRNHSINTLNINSSGNIQTVYLEYDRSNLFNYLQPGDTVIKEYDTEVVLVSREGVITRFEIDFGCNK